MIRRKSRLTIAWGIFCLFTVKGIAGSHEQAVEEMHNNNYAVAYYLWRPLADDGDAEAQYNLGWMYHNGYGLSINNQKAETLWRQAADQDHAEAAFALANLYSLGEDGVPRDYAKALRLWAKASALGHGDAALALQQLGVREEPEIETMLADLLAQNPQLFGKAATITADRVNLRRGPGTEHVVVTVLERGMRVVELLRLGSWVKVGIATPPQLGWVHEKLIEVSGGIVDRSAPVSRGPIRQGGESSDDGES